MKTQKKEFVLYDLPDLNAITICKKDGSVEITIVKDKEFNKKYYIGNNLLNPPRPSFVNLDKNSENQFTLTLLQDAYEIVLQRLSSQTRENEEVKLMLPPIDGIPEKPMLILNLNTLNTKGCFSCFPCCRPNPSQDNSRII